MDQDDQRAFREFVGARMASLRSLAYVTCGDWHAAEDAVANALIKLYARWRRVDRPDLYAQTMVYRAAVDETRRSWWRRERPAGDAMPDVESADPAGVSDERIRVRQALMAVPPGQRAVLFLRYYQGLTIEEAADVLGCHPGTVKSQAARGLARLRERLKDLSESDELEEHADACV
ncbi:SigE family RNA polymerase sigma factor [Dactylosporangium sp. NPDC005572]|uniref:SigE family RNA polymerase sigma factor n=1 Tax=Dactylosporangium sp. NPDC005572 TaxID=3156889 RepID=UPI0033B3014F